MYSNAVKKEAEHGFLFYNVKSYLKLANHLSYLLNVQKSTLPKSTKEFENGQVFTYRQTKSEMILTRIQ